MRVFLTGSEEVRATTCLGEESPKENGKQGETKEIEMATATKNRFKGKVRDAYLELILKFPLTSIQSEQDLDAAQKVIDELLTKGKLLSGEMLYLDALSDLVATYEDQHYPISPASDADMLRQLIEARGISQSVLSREAGISKSTISEILSGKKNFSRSLIRKLSDFFDVDVSVLAHNL